MTSVSAVLIRSHNVTHLQFTPSMAAMLLMDEDTRRALRDVRHLFVGGEALQAALVRELRSVTDATIDNMYGPTETTIWSATTVVGEQPDGVVPLGTPIANTQLYVLDHARRPVPAGQPGELFIGGDGVARGYLQRPELTANAFCRTRLQLTAGCIAPAIWCAGTSAARYISLAGPTIR